MTVLAKPKKPKAKKVLGGATVPLNPGLRKGDMGLAKYLRKIYGTAPSNAQIQQQTASSVKSQIDPVLAEINRSNQAETERGMAQIKGAGEQEIGRLRQVSGQVRSDYERAASHDQQAGEALSTFLREQGQQGGSELQTKLSAINAPEEAIKDVAGGARALGSGSAGEAAARGYGQQSHTIGSGAAQVALADTLGGIGGLEAASNLSNYTRDRSQALADERGKVTSQVPGIVAGLYGDLQKGRDEQRSATGTALSSFLGGALDRNTQAEIARAGFGKDVYGIDVGAQVDQSVADTRAAAAAAKDARSQAKKKNTAHTTALHNMNTAKLDTGQAVQKFATTLLKPQYKTVLKQTSKFSPPTKVRVPLPVPGYNEILRRAMQMPEVRELSTRYGVRPQVLHEIVRSALAAAGLHPPKPPRVEPPGAENPARTPLP